MACKRDLITRTNAHLRTAKPCGPGIPVLMPSSCLLWRARGRRGQDSRSPGRARSNRNTIAQGRLGCLGRTCGNRRVHSFSHAGHGGGELPAFPAPSRFSRAMMPPRLGRKRAARTRAA